MLTNRNELLVEYEPIIKWVIRNNQTLIRALALDYDDVYQDLCIAAIKAIDGFDPERSSSLKTHLVCKLQYEIKNLKVRYKPYGMTGTKKACPTFHSLDDQWKNHQIDIPVDSPFDFIEFKEALTMLSFEERKAVTEKICGKQRRTQKYNELLETAMKKLAAYYGKAASVLC